MTAEQLFELADRLDELVNWYAATNCPSFAARSRDLSEIVRADAHLVARAELAVKPTNHDHLPGKEPFDGLW